MCHKKLAKTSPSRQCRAAVTKARLKCSRTHLKLVAKQRAQITAGVQLSGPSIRRTSRENIKENFRSAFQRERFLTVSGKWLTDPTQQSCQTSRITKRTPSAEPIMDRNGSSILNICQIPRRNLSYLSLLIGKLRRAGLAWYEWIRVFDRNLLEF